MRNGRHLHQEYVAWKADPEARRSTSSRLDPAFSLLRLSSDECGDDIQEVRLDPLSFEHLDQSERLN